MTAFVHVPALFVCTVQAASTAITTWPTARTECVVTVTTSASNRRAVPAVPPSVTQRHPMTASSETRPAGVIRHSSSRSTATRRPMPPAVRHVPPTGLDHPVYWLTLVMRLQSYIRRTVLCKNNYDNLIIYYYFYTLGRYDLEGA